MSNLKSLKTVTRLCLFSDNIKDRVNQLCPFRIMTFCPIVSSSGLSKYEIVRSKELTERTSSNRVHSPWLQIHQNRSWDITSTSGFVVVNIDPLKLQIRITMVCTCWVDSVLIRDYLPELSSDLISALTCLDMYDFTHDNESFLDFTSFKVF